MGKYKCLSPAEKLSVVLLAVAAIALAICHSINTMILICMLMAFVFVNIAMFVRAKRKMPHVIMCLACIVLVIASFVVMVKASFFPFMFEGVISDKYQKAGMYVVRAEVLYPNRHEISLICEEETWKELESGNNTYEFSIQRNGVFNKIGLLRNVESK